jgi:hypothetical protein
MQQYFFCLEYVGVMDNELCNMAKNAFGNICSTLQIWINISILLCEVYI